MADSATNEQNLRIVSFHIAKNAVSLNEELKKMNSNERSSVLAANQYGDLGNPALVYAVERSTLTISILPVHQQHLLLIYSCTWAVLHQ